MEYAVIVEGTRIMLEGRSGGRKKPEGVYAIQADRLTSLRSNSYPELPTVVQWYKNVNE